MFIINHHIAQSAKNQRFELLKQYKNNGKNGYLVYRGYFGGKHNFAYAQLSTMELDTESHQRLKENHLKIAKYYH